jgi:alkanesulfonate monooxygenase SsuD/methylene tetrahydromethanopterin reductase-like flavin-dependent oxidoreductase (luciferase family)
MREQIEAMRAIWTEEEPEYHGEIIDFPKMKTWPKPVQKPHPPVIVGGAFPHSARRAVRYGDGWVPNASRPQYADVSEFLPQFRQMAAEAGRDPAGVPVSIFGAPEDPDRLRRYRDAGVARAIVALPSAKADEILPVLDRWAELIRRTAQ